MHIYHGSNLRKGRVSESGRAYLVTTVTLARRPLFQDWRMGRLLVDELRLASSSGQADTLAYVIMPDHLHWLMVLHHGSLSNTLRRIKSRSAIRINQQRNEPGAIWQKGYHDHALREEEDIHEAARYIVANPLRAGIVDRIGDYLLWDAIWL